VTNKEPGPRLPYSWNCAWCKRQYVGLDRREPAHVRGQGSYLFCTTHCLRAWQTEQIPPALRREARYAVVSHRAMAGQGFRHHSKPARRGRLNEPGIHTQQLVRDQPPRYKSRCL
jgi:hypothetical protein